MLQIRGSGGSSKTRGGGVNVASLNSQSYVGEEGNDASRGWPVFENVKQKEVKTVLPHTRQLFVFLGSNRAHRTPQALEARAQNRRTKGRRMEGQTMGAAIQDKAWAQRFRLTRGGGDE